MKSSLFIFLGLIALSFANPNKTETHKTHHTFLVKTELTKEQIENLLNQHHMNHTHLTQKTNLHQNENETHEHQNTPNEEQETTQLKKQKNKNKEQKEEKEQKHEQVQEKEQEPKTEVPNTNEEKPAAESLVEKEVEPMEQEGEKETTNLKKKKEQKEEKKRIHNSEIKEVNEAESKELMNETEALIEVGHNNDCQNQTTTLMAKREYVEQNNLNQSNSPIFGFISVVLLTIAFVSLIVYTTQPKKKVHDNYYMNQRIKVKV